MKVLDKNLRGVDRESILAYMRSSLTVKAPSLVKGAPPRARARANAATPSTCARVRLFIFDPSSFPSRLSWGAGGGATRDGGARGCAAGGGARGGGAVVAQPVVAPLAAPVAATMGATAGPPTAALDFGLFDVIFPFWM